MADLFELNREGLARTEQRVVSAARPFHIDLGSIAYQAKKKLQVLDDAVDVALARAIKKTTRWLAYHSAKELKTALRLKNTKRLKDRIKIFTNRNAGQTSIWFGLAPIEIEAAGSPRQNSLGTRVAGRQYDGAFYTSIYGNTPFVYIRAARNAQEGHTTYRRNSKGNNPNSIRDEELKGRFPVQRLGLDIEEPATYILESFERRTNSRFQTLFDQELNFELSKRGVST
ncbi:hypothetical protein M9194_19735 [Vibrio sp. S4M6]|uniref:hypothetical protein n=1 Tax=Vibrio sinus TaxID=2946865 RepID=UPI00202A4225|nr:hypothetical protein [Vibrio sinus]MCL9783660.1 hypothetical protein [Vibrio sinus]